MAVIYPRTSEGRLEGAPQKDSPLLLESWQDASLWDDSISAYPDRQVFHSRDWLEYLAASRGVSIGMWRLVKDSGTAGHFCAGILSKGPFRILGSPLKGWGTNSMGPLLASDSDLRPFLLAIDSLARREHLAIAELEHPRFDGGVMTAAGYSASTLWTYHVCLDSDEDAMLKRMSKGRRSGIRKAIHSGLTVEETGDPHFADEYYDQFRALMKRKGLPVSYTREIPQLLMRCLHPAGRMLALRVRDGEGRVLATGLFPHGNGVLYFWGGASVPERVLCPNDLLHWHAMRWAAQTGMHTYDMSGWGQFKKEFGGDLVTVQRWHKTYSLPARWARSAYETWLRQRGLVNTWFGRLAARQTSSAMAREKLLPAANRGM